MRKERVVGKRYVWLYLPEHPKASPKGFIHEHIVLVEKILGRYLPPGAEVHHWNEDKRDNSLHNLLLCPSRAYHSLVHSRTRALEACGVSSFKKCPYCQTYDDPVTMQLHNRRDMQYCHAACHTAYERQRKIKKENKKMILTTLERLLLLNILPKEGDFTTIKIVRKLREALSFTEEEHAVRKFNTSPEGNTTWTLGTPDAVEISIGEKAADMIVVELKKLNDEKKLSEQTFSLYEKFVGEK